MIPTLIIVGITLISIILSILFFPKLIIGKFHISIYWIIALVGAIILMCSNLANYQVVFNQLVDNSSSINPIKILILFFSMSFLSVYLESIGFFSYIANKAVTKAKSKQIILFLILYLLTSVLTVFTSNDIVILTFTPFICYFCKHANIKATPYLVAEFTAANTWSLMLIIGNPTNLYLATNAGINFIQYFEVMWLPTLVAGIVELGILLLIFIKPLKRPLVSNDDTCEGKIDSKMNLFVGLSGLFGCIIFLTISSYLNLPMWLIAFIFALLILLYALITNIIHNNFKHFLSTLKRLPYELIPFVLSMFVIVVSLKEQNITSFIVDFLGDQNTIWTYGYSGFVMSNLINNIPMSILYSSILDPSSSFYLEATYSSIIGSNIGAFLTPIGALAGIMFTSLLKKYNVSLGFKRFCFYGLIVSIPTISVALLMLQLIL